MVLLMIMSFLTAWMCYAMVCFLRLLGVEFSPEVVGVAMLLAKGSKVLNASVLVFMNEQVSRTTAKP